MGSIRIVMFFVLERRLRPLPFEPPPHAREPPLLPQNDAM